MPCFGKITCSSYIEEPRYLGFTFSFAFQISFLNITGFRDFPLGDLPMLQVCHPVLIVNVRDKSYILYNHESLLVSHL